MTSNVWYQGSINEAVQLVNAKNCLFVVYIHDDSGTSAQLDELLTKIKVQNVLKEHVSIKLDRQSENAQMFGQFYPIQRVPMVYFIKQGVIKDFAIETTTELEFVDKTDRLTSSSPSANTVSSAPPPTEATTSEFSPETPGYTLAAAPAHDVDSTDTTRNDTTNDQSTSQNTEQSMESTSDSDKKARLKRQMEDARKRRDEIEKENEKKREIKRRQDGKEAQLTQQQLQDQQNKLYFAKIKKEKQADEEHRRKVKEQIARDREEKMAERQKRSQQSPAATSSSTSQQQQKQKDARQYDMCHLNIRQGDGANMRNAFNAQDTLGQVRNWIDENRTDGDQPYKLLAQFPTRQFSAGDEEKTLRTLDLVPSGTIIMKPIKNVASAYQSPSGYGGMVADYVYSAGGMVYNTLSGVGASVTGALGGMFTSVAPVAVTGPDGHRLGGPQQQQQQQQASPLGSRQIHGINTLRQDGVDDDDRKRTYNGNSVNQE